MIKKNVFLIILQYINMYFKEFNDTIDTGK